MMCSTLAVALLFSTGCGDSGGSAEAAPAAAAPSASPSPPPQADAAVCTDLKATHLQYYGRFDDQWKAVVAATNRKDNMAVLKGAYQLQTIAKEWAVALEPLVGKVQQAELRQPLTALLAAVQQYSTTVAEKFQFDDIYSSAVPAMAAMSERCPN